MGSSVLSGLISLFVIKLYVRRVRYQDEHMEDLDMGMEGGGEYKQPGERYK